ncbi:peptidoglycan DD-metalloendopeptidase family protein [Longispora sp. K20-0274]|uniref:peptidoglycan DD-metalloendopeptidase family protein n=1 Tax=Longispora sp. K20-0274 TaxID=3088255 RepID=UPI00399C337C
MLTLMLAPAVPARATDSLEDTVASRLRARLTLESDRPVRVSVLRGGPATGFLGSAVLPGGTGYPEGWLFLHAGGETAFEGDPGFAALAGRVSVLSAEEHRVFGQARGYTAPPASKHPAKSGADYRTALRLPYALGQAWSYTGGPHPMAGSARSSIDLAGGDGRVLAAGSGLAYTMCDSKRGWLRVVHDRGLATDYYHLAGNIAANGDRVAEGDFLGNIGTDVSCGGSASGSHVHFSLRRDGAYVPIDHYVFGKWVIRAQGDSYDGYAMHGSTRVEVDGRLPNYGPLALNQGLVDTDGGTALNRRAGPGTTQPILGTVGDGETVTIQCSSTGTDQAGRDGYHSTLWDKLTDGSWVSDVYVWTGTGEPVAGTC